jgi:T5orf172 domain
MLTILGRRFIDSTLRRFPRPGWVYVLTNPSIPRRVKIGMTTRSPQKRAVELKSGTGLPTAFAVHCCTPVSNCLFVEQAVHRMLADKRIRKSEFFAVDPDTARRTIEAAAGALLDPRAVERADTKQQPRRGGRSKLRSHRIHVAGRPRVRKTWRRKSNVPRLFLTWLARILLLGVAGVALFRPTLPNFLPQPLILILSVIEDLAALLFFIPQLQKAARGLRPPRAQGACARLRAALVLTPSSFRASLPRASGWRAATVSHPLHLLPPQPWG